MRKILSAYFISLFFLSGLFGFGVVSQVRAAAESEATSLSPATQINLILVHVDDLKLDHPDLTSIWGVFISRSIYPGLIMKRIYPELSSPASARLAAAFSVDRQKQLDRKFLDVMRDLDMPAAEIFLVDNEGMAEVAAALSHQINQDNMSNHSLILHQSDLDLFRGICATIDTPAGAITFISAELPNIGITSGGMSSFGYLNKWEGLVTSLHFTSCEVLAGP
jgi:hypothetical protein